MTTSALDLRLESLLGSGAIPVLGEVVEGARPTGVAPANEARATASVWGLSAEDKDVSPEEHRDLSSSTHTPRAGNPPAYLLSVSDFPLGGDDFGRPSPAYSRLSYTFDNPAILRGENHEDHAATMSQDFYIRSQRNDPRTPSPRSQASLQHGRPQHAGKMRSQATMGPEPDPHMKENDDNPPELYHDRDMWDMYLDQAFPEDKETSDGWDSDLDSMLIFAAIFSAVLTAFVIESYQSLQPNSADTSVVLLQAILMGLQANSTPPLPAAVTSQFRPTGSAVRVNIYWFASLIISLSTALIAILAKQWVHFLHSGLSPVRETRVRQRQYRMDGLQKWRLPAVLSFLPVLLHIALLLFFAGLLDFAWSLNRAVAITSFILVFVTFLTYAAANDGVGYFAHLQIVASAEASSATGVTRRDIGHME
ncbi:hypothetical protein OBBRIDRAFT_817205 [Obba rivulosa]|uniref:DUF6535 domain-containing protein n=1 Tax=Obba rivulosa TaxID=1052685 RepID=A0A8E2DRB3_9APHY|nr:hypothetical protein OBBRIDRAFT_817205 [Obba rivulosa]